MQTCDPLTARQWFKLRTAANWAMVIVGFAWLVFVLQSFIHPVIADLIAISIAFCVFFFVLHKRAIGIDCPHCRQYIETNTPWICGFKQCRNEQVDDFPFIYRCQHCGAEPKAYQCHHCEKLIFFTKDQQTINYAKCVNLPDNSKLVKKDRHAEDIVKEAKDLQLTDLKVKKAKLSVELKGYDEILKPKKTKTQREILQEDFSNFEDRTMSGAEIVRRKKADNAEKYKDNPDELKRQNLLVDQWAQNNFDKL